MLQPVDPNPPRLSAEDAFLELLINTLETLERPARGQFLQRFFRSVAHVDLAETQSLDIWDQALARRRELSEGADKKIAVQTALVDVLASAASARQPATHLSSAGEYRHVAHRMLVCDINDMDLIDFSPTATRGVEFARTARRGTA